MNTAARGVRRRRALARRRRAPTGLDQSHEDGANRAGISLPSRDFHDTPLPDFHDTPPTKRTPTQYLVNTPLSILNNTPLLIFVEHSPLVGKCRSPPHTFKTLHAPQHETNPLLASHLPAPRDRHAVPMSKDFAHVEQFHEHQCIQSSHKVLSNRILKSEKFCDSHCLHKSFSSRH